MGTGKQGSVLSLWRSCLVAMICPTQFTSGRPIAVRSASWWL